MTRDVDADAKKKAVMDAVHMNFKPEYLNRLDDIVMFHPLRRWCQELGGIVDIQVAGVSQRLTDRRITLDVTDSGSRMAGQHRLLTRLMALVRCAAWCAAPKNGRPAGPYAAGRQGPRR